MGTASAGVLNGGSSHERSKLGPVVEHRGHRVHGRAVRTTLPLPAADNGASRRRHPFVVADHRPLDPWSAGRGAERGALVRLDACRRLLASCAYSVFLDYESRREFVMDMYLRGHILDL